MAARRKPVSLGLGDAGSGDTILNSRAGIRYGVPGTILNSRAGIRFGGPGTRAGIRYGVPGTQVRCPRNHTQFKGRGSGDRFGGHHTQFRAGSGDRFGGHHTQFKGRVRGTPYSIQGPFTHTQFKGRIRYGVPGTPPEPPASARRIATYLCRSTTGPFGSAPITNRAFPCRSRLLTTNPTNHTNNPDQVDYHDNYTFIRLIGQIRGLH